MNDRLRRIFSRALSSWETIQNTYDLADRCVVDEILGDFVECGVFCGAQVAAMALACLDRGVTRTIHLFDSFEGIPQAGPNDDETITGCIGESDGTGKLVTTGVSASSVAEVQARMSEWGIPGDMLVYHKGWVQDSIPGALSGGHLSKGIALLRLDVDLYNATKVCFDNLAPLVHQGGWFILDDGNLTGAVKAMNEYLVDQTKQQANLQKVPNSNPLFWQKL